MLAHIIIIIPGGNTGHMGLEENLARCCVQKAGDHFSISIDKLYLSEKNKSNVPIMLYFNHNEYI